MLRELKEKLAEHPDKGATAQWAIELKASGRYGRYLTITKGGKLKGKGDGGASGGRDQIP